ncbi:MAG: hypothetical protein Q8Q32_02530 [bacterium]|nr:hypothetical protein [bacterium]
MKAQISYKNILKATLATVILVTGLLTLLIWIFGDESYLRTEIVRSPNLSNFEEFKKITSPAKSNLTNDISEVIAREIAELNPQGPTQGSSDETQIAALDPEKLLDKTIQEGLKNFNPDQLRYQAGLSQIQSTESNIKEKQAEYFEEINDIVNTAFKNAETINYAYLPETNFQSIIASYDDAIGRLYKTKVPSDLLAYHINLISLLGTHQNVYAVLANFEDDPLQAYLAADFGLQIENEIVFLSNDMNQYIKDNEIFEN